MQEWPHGASSYSRSAPHIHSLAPVAPIRRALFGFALALTLVAASARAQNTATLEPGNTVARLGLDAPDATSFVVHGTIPVPRGVFPRADGQAPFKLRNPNGTLVPAQTEVVSRYSNPDYGADVVEVSARVTRPPSAPKDAPIAYDVVFEPHMSKAMPELDPRIVELLASNQSMLISARDVFGNWYFARPRQGTAPIVTMREGGSVFEFRTYASLVPPEPHGGPQGTLPHLMGMHAYFRLYDGSPSIELDLRFHNGHSGLDQSTDLDNPMSKIYFDELSLWVPDNWNVRQGEPDLYTGQPELVGTMLRYPLIAHMPGNQLHMMPSQAMTMRRLVLSPRGENIMPAHHVEQRGQAFARRGVNGQGQELFSWWNDATGRYYPQRHVLPRLDFVQGGSIAADLAFQHLRLSDCLRTGEPANYPVISPALGWSHPWGINDGGMAGGDDIAMFDPLGLKTLETASNKGYRVIQMKHRMYNDRQPVALYNQDGKPSEYTQWTQEGQTGTWLPAWYFLRPILWAADPFGFLDAPTFQVDAVAAQGRQPAYEQQLLSYEPIDLEHLVRYTAPAKSLIWIGNDSLAKDNIRLHAALYRFGYNDLPNSDYGHYISTGLAADSMYVADYPDQGFNFGRMEGWGIDCVNAAYSTYDLETRTDLRRWYEQITDTVYNGQSGCSGIIQATVYEQLFGGLYRARQSIEQAIVENMLVGVRESVMQGTDPLRAHKLNLTLRASFRSMVNWPAWNGIAHAPWQKLAVGDADFTHDPFCKELPNDAYADGGDAYQCWGSFAYAYELTGDTFYLNRAAEMAGGVYNLLAALEAAGLGNIENKAALIGMLQQTVGNN
jgi:hypothetical protein